MQCDFLIYFTYEMLWLIDSVIPNGSALVGHEHIFTPNSISVSIQQIFAIDLHFSIISFHIFFSIKKFIRRETNWKIKLNFRQFTNLFNDKKKMTQP